MDEGRTPGLVWTRLQQPGPPSRRDLSLAKVTAEVVVVLDERGVLGLTMRGVAERLEIAAGTLYRYCRDREELLDLALDHAYGEMPTVDPGDGATWREPARAYLQATRGLCEQHPWLPEVYASRPSIGPHGMQLREVLLTILARAGFAGADLVAAENFLGHLAIGYAGLETSFGTWARRSPVDVDAVRRHVVGAVADHPHSAATIRDVLSVTDPAELRVLRWDFTVAAALDGLAGRLAIADATADGGPAGPGVDVHTEVRPQPGR